MIFLTVGTQLPFDRLVSAVDAWAGAHPDHPIFGQIADPGPDGYRPKNFEWVAHLNPPEFQARFDAASHIVAHAGMGTIIGALTQGKPLLIMARRAHLKEQRNDHQRATVEHFRAKPNVLVAETSDEIAARMSALVETQASPEAEIQTVAQTSLTDAICETLGLAS